MIRWQRALLVAVKELRDTLRDRRTLLMMVLVPALLYPLGGIAITQLTVSTMARLDREGFTVATPKCPLPEVLAAALQRDEGLTARQVADVAAALGQPPQGAPIGLTWTEVAGPRFTQVRAEVLYDSASPRSLAALDRLRRALEAEAGGQRERRLQQLSLSEADLRPLSFSERSVATKTQTALSYMAPMIGFLLLLLSLIGAFYPAIDLIAGERERGTLEPLLVTPTSRLEILAGKYACLAVLALLSCVLNLAFLALTTGFMLNKVEGAHIALTPGLLLLTFAATVPVLLLVTALLLLAAVFARSFKDAQNLMTPVYMACLVPAFGALVPESHLTERSALMPVLNTVLFIKEVLSGTLQPVPGFLAIAAGLFYSILAIAAAALVFDRPELLGTRVADNALSGLAVQVGRDGRSEPTLTGALGLYGLCLALLFYVGPLLQQHHLRLGLLITEAGLLLGPVLLYLRAIRVPVSRGLDLRPVSAVQVGGGALAGLGGLLLSIFLWLFLAQPLLHPGDEYLRAIQALQPHGAADTVVMVLLAALLPAVCEESLCRGLLLRTARLSLGAAPAIALSGFTFALLHLDPYRFLGTLVLGCLLAVVAVRSRSIVPAMVMHFSNNSVALCLGDRLEAVLPQQGAKLALNLLIGAALFLGAGLILVRAPDRPTDRTGGDGG